MKKMLIAILVVAFAWSAYWGIGWIGVKSGFATWFEDRRSEGWLAEYSTLKVRGFPNRFDTTIEDLSLADPDTGLAWDMPFFQVFALSYQPNHVIAVWPHRQSIATPSQKIAVNTGDMRASLVVQPKTDLALDRANLVVNALSLTSSNGWQSTADVVQLAAHLLPESDATYRLAIETRAFSPPSLLRLRLDPDNHLPDTLKTLEIDMTVGFDRAWDRFAIETARPQPIEIDLTRAQATWGELELMATGKMILSDTGIPSGNITIRAKNWRDIVKLARASGEFHKVVIDTVEGALEILSGLSGNPKTLDIPLTLKGGAVRLGPVPLAKAPRLRLR